MMPTSIDLAIYNNMYLLNISKPFKNNIGTIVTKDYLTNFISSIIYVLKIIEEYKPIHHLEDSQRRFRLSLEVKFLAQRSKESTILISIHPI